MKHFKLTILFTILMSMVGAKAFAHDIEMPNDDGVLIYYKFINDYKELAVTYRGDFPYSFTNEYLSNVVIPKSVEYWGRTYSVTAIGDEALYGCSGLTSITIPNSVTSIGDLAFSGCSGLTSITIPNSVTSIGEEAFFYCSGLTSMTVKSENTKYDSKNNCNAIIETASNTLVAGCKATIIPNSVTSIGKWAFRYCSGLTSITIPNSVTSIGSWAFEGCSGLTSVTIPNSVTSIGTGAFYGTAWYNSQSDGLVYAGKVVYSYKGTMPANTSISVIDGTLGIAESAFYGRSGLTSITIPNSVMSIGESAFKGCTNLTSVTIPNSVTSIGYYTFYNCTGLTSITIGNGVTSIGGFAFKDCTGLKKVIVKDITAWCGINFSESYANPLSYAHHLYSNENAEITDLVIPESVTSIGNYAFSGCSGLTSITIGNGVTSIGRFAFIDCTGLKKVIAKDIAAWCGINFGYDDANPLYYTHHLYSDSNTEIKDLVIPDGVTNIGSWAFCDCTGLTSITIPNSVTSIGAGVFSGCSGLTSVTALNPTPVAITQYVFTNRKNATLYVPNGSKSAYQAAKYWKEFKEIVEIDVSEIDISNIQFNLTYIVDGEEYKTYKLKGNEVITPEPDPIKEGYTFSGWSEIPSTMPYHDVTINGYFRKNGTSVYKPLDDYIANSVTSLSNNSYYISPTINNVERVYVDLTKSTSNSSYCYIGIKNKVNTKMIDFSSKYLQSTSSDNLVVYEGSNSIRQSIKILANNNTYSWLYYNPENPNEVIIDVKAYFGCSGYIEKWQKNFGTSCVVNIETENAETSIHDIRESSIKDDRYYNLQGQRVISPKKGIYIINGKKVIIK